MPIDYNTIMLDIRDKLSDFYSNHTFPSGNNKSSQFEKAVEKVSRQVFKTYDNANGLPEGYHVVEYLGGSTFPDIVAHIGNTNQKIGIEAKYHSSGDDWKTKGNSTYANTQVDGLLEIYVAFGRFDHNACNIKVRPYGRCISGISITHSPRYDIDMDTTVDFCSAELGISYDTLRQLTSAQRKIHINTYIAKTKYTSFSNIETDRKNTLITQAFILFPEMFSRNSLIRYNNFSVWLFANNIICKNVRDFLTAGGQSKIGGITFPKIYVTLYSHIDHIRNTIENIPPQVLARAWYGSVAEVEHIPANADERLRIWLDLATACHGGDATSIKDTTLNFKNTLSSWFDI
ncbi:MAG: hypothetical protein RR413_09330 [Christensenellaceae bacterium]